MSAGSPPNPLCTAISGTAVVAFAAIHLRKVGAEVARRSSEVVRQQMCLHVEDEFVAGENGRSDLRFGHRGRRNGERAARLRGERRVDRPLGGVLLLATGV